MICQLSECIVPRRGSSQLVEHSDELEQEVIIETAPSIDWSHNERVGLTGLQERASQHRRPLAGGRETYSIPGLIVNKQAVVGTPLGGVSCIPSVDHTPHLRQVLDRRPNALLTFGGCLYGVFVPPKRCETLSTLRTRRVGVIEEERSQAKGAKMSFSERAAAEGPNGELFRTRRGQLLLLRSEKTLTWYGDCRCMI